MTTVRVASLAVGLAVIALVGGCAPAAPVTSSEPSPSASAPAPPAWGDVSAELAELEQQSGRRIGVWAVDLASGAVLEVRADERFGFASTIKLLQAGLLLHAEGVAALDEAVPIDTSVPVQHSPVTEAAAGGTLTLGEVAGAAVSQSDNGAANLLFDRAGGPAAVDASLAEVLGDEVTELTRREPELSRTVPGEPADTTTPAALGRDVQLLATGDVLPPDAREQLLAWMRATNTGDGTIRAGAPDGWTVANKTGSGAYGTRNDVAVLEPPDGSPLVLAIMTDALDPQAAGASAPWRDDVVAEATRIVLAARPGGA